jgi:hypothetical protein
MGERVLEAKRVGEIRARGNAGFHCGHSVAAAESRIADIVIARSVATKQIQSLASLDCFAEPVIGRRFAPTRWLAMTKKGGLAAALLLIR